MRRGFGGAALLIALVAAPDADAQLLSAEPVLGSAPPAPPMAPDAAQVSVSRDIFKRSPGVSVSAQSQSEPDGSTATRRGLIGSWRITGGVEAGVGLFSVTGDERKHNEFKRDWAVKQMTPKNRTVAAVGMNLRF